MLIWAPQLHTAIAILATLPMACGLMACGGAAQGAEHPEHAIVSYRAAIEAGDAERTHALLDEASQARLSRDRVAALLQENQQELGEQTAALSDPGTESEALAHIRLENGDVVSLVLEDGGWRMDGGVLGAPSLRTPEDAVRALRVALSRRSLSGVERVLAREPRTQMQADIQRILDETEDELDLEVDVRGDRARVRTTDGRSIVLVRESGEWRILTIR